MSTQIGIFGGTFDPPHLGHLKLVKAACIQLDLDRVLWVLTPNPPLKIDQVITPVEHRMAMLEIALAGHPEFELSHLELDRPGPQYALETVELVADKNPGAELIYLMGADSLQSLPKWHLPKDFLSILDCIGVINRPGTPLDLSDLEEVLPGISRKVRLVKAPLVDISSSKIRTLAGAGKSFRRYVPTLVYNYIVEHHLYSR